MVKITDLEAKFGAGVFLRCLSYSKAKHRDIRFEPDNLQLGPDFKIAELICACEFDSEYFPELSHERVVCTEREQFIIFFNNDTFVGETLYDFLDRGLDLSSDAWMEIARFLIGSSNRGYYTLELSFLEKFSVLWKTVEDDLNLPSLDFLFQQQWPDFSIFEYAATQPRQCS